MTRALRALPMPDEFHGDLADLAAELEAFADERDWHQFHSPKNLSMALAVEAAELMELFQWLETTESRSMEDEAIGRVREELGDVLIYLVRMADVMGIDPLEAAWEKLEANRAKYPADRVRGRALKYDELDT